MVWQSLDMNELAKPVPPLSRAGKVTDFSRQLRDFSTRLVPDEKMEIFSMQEEQTTDDMTLSGGGEDAGEQDIIQSVPEQMIPFSVEKSDNNTNSLPDIEAVRAQAFAQGKEEGKKCAREEYDAERHRLIEDHAQTLAQTRQDVIDTIAGDLLATCQVAFGALQTSLERDLAPLIAALIGERLTAEAIAEFTRQLTNETIEASLPLIIEGAPALLDAFVAHASTSATIDLKRYQLKACEETGLRLIYGDRVLSTRLSPLLRQLREII